MIILIIAKKLVNSSVYTAKISDASRGNFIVGSVNVKLEKRIKSKFVDWGGKRELL